jgi:hypothetical protein
MNFHTFGMQKLFPFHVFFCENELIPVKFLCESREIFVFQSGPKSETMLLFKARFLEIL